MYRTVATIFRTLIFPNFFQPLPKPNPCLLQRVYPIPYTLQEEIEKNWGKFEFGKKVARSL